MGQVAFLGQIFVIEVKAEPEAGAGPAEGHGFGLLHGIPIACVVHRRRSSGFPINLEAIHQIKKIHSSVG